MPDATVKAVLEGGWRCKAVHFIQGENFLEAELEKISAAVTGAATEAEALRRTVLSEFGTYARLNPKMPDGVARAAEEISDPDVFADIIASNSVLKHAEKQIILENRRCSQKASFPFKTSHQGK